MIKLILFSIYRLISQVHNNNMLMDENDSPVIGMLAAPYCISKDPNLSGFHSDKCEDSPMSGINVAETLYLTQAGAKVVPIPYNMPHTKLLKLIPTLNGIFFTGGNDSLKYNTTYFNTAKLLFDSAKQRKDSNNGESIPILGVCMGMQLLTLLVSQDHTVLKHGKYKSHGIALPLEKYVNEPNNIKDSHIFGEAPNDVLDTLFTQNMTVNYHYDGISSSTFRQNKYLKDFYRILSINHDLLNQEFVSTIESRDYSFYGTQWHPEVNQWSQIENTHFFPRTPKTIKAIQYIANHFVEESRRSKRIFNYTNDEFHLVDYYTPIHVGSTSEIYLFE